MNRHQKRLLTLSSALLVGAGMAMKSKANEPIAKEPVASLASAEREVRAFLEREVAQAAASFPGRIEIAVGAVDPRRNLPACEKVEPFLPPGTRLWGKANVGLRCRAGAAWTVFLPIDVKIFAPALVTARPLAIGQPIEPADVKIEEVELTREPAGALSDPAALEERVAARALPAGALLRPEHLRTRPVIAQGDMVKVVYLGAGFSVATEGKALTAAASGQSVRVQMDTGRVVSGTAREGRRVELR